MDEDDLIGMAILLSPIILGALTFLVADGNMTEETIACIEAGMEWIDGNCVKGEKE